VIIFHSVQVPIEEIFLIDYSWQWLGCRFSTRHHENEARESFHWFQWSFEMFQSIVSFQFTDKQSLTMTFCHFSSVTVAWALWKASRGRLSMAKHFQCFKNFDFMDDEKLYMQSLKFSSSYQTSYLHQISVVLEKLSILFKRLCCHNSISDTS
jgi:hypothetical protein